LITKAGAMPAFFFAHFGSGRCGKAEAQACFVRESAYTKSSLPLRTALVGTVVVRRGGGVIERQ